MKRGRDVHAPKSNQQKVAYKKVIERLESEPTVSTPRRLDSSDTPAETDAAIDDDKPRPRSPLDRLMRHLSENWPQWLFGAVFAGVSVLLTYLFVTSNVQIAKLDLTQSQHTSDIDKLEHKAIKSEATQHEHELAIKESSIRVEHLGSALNKVDSKLEGLDVKVRSIESELNAVKNQRDEPRKQGN